MAHGRILYIEDEPRLSETVVFNLRAEGYETYAALDGKTGYDLAVQEAPDLIILDLILPEIDGLDLLRLLTSSHRTRHIPVLILSARSEELDRVVGLEIGASDYLTKPFSMRELLARVRALLRRERTVPETPGSSIMVNPVFMNREFARLRNSTFVLMPFSTAWSERVWRLIQDICGAQGFTCKRADDIYGTDVLEDIWTAINSFSTIIADISSRNPNVMYEIGIAHTVGKPVILLTQQADDIPFDFRRYRHIEYADNVDGFEKLQTLLPNFLRMHKQLDQPILSEAPARRPPKKTRRRSR